MWAGLLLLTSLAAAQQSDTAGARLKTDTPTTPPTEQDQGPPLAIPAGDEPSAGAKLAIPGSTRKIEEVRAYQKRALDVRELTYMQGAGAVVTTWDPWWGVGWGYRGYYGWGWGWGGPAVTVVSSPSYTVSNWGVYQGPNRLDTPTFLERVGDMPAHAALSRKIKANRNAASMLYGASVVGLAATVTGIIGSEAARTPEDYVAWSGVAVGGLATTLIGGITATIPANRARRLVFYPGESMSYDEVVERTDRYNADLRQELGISQDDVERAPPAPRDRR